MTTAPGYKKKATYLHKLYQHMYEAELLHIQEHGEEGYAGLEKYSLGLQEAKRTKDLLTRRDTIHPMSTVGDWDKTLLLIDKTYSLIKKHPRSVAHEDLIPAVASLYSSCGDYAQLEAKIKEEIHKFTPQMTPVAIP